MMRPRYEYLFSQTVCGFPCFCRRGIHDKISQYSGRTNLYAASLAVQSIPHARHTYIHELMASCGFYEVPAVLKTATGHVQKIFNYKHGVHVILTMTSTVVAIVIIQNCV